MVSNHCPSYRIAHKRNTSLTCKSTTTYFMTLTAHQMNTQQTRKIDTTNTLSTTSYNSDVLDSTRLLHNYIQSVKSPTHSFARHLYCFYGITTYIMDSPSWPRFFIVGYIFHVLTHLHLVTQD